MTSSGRRLVALAAALAAAGVGCTGSPPGPPVGSRSVSGMARELGKDVVRTLHQGYVPGRSGEILLIPRPGNVILRRGLDPRFPSRDTSHATPWDYHQRVPIILYGPGHVREGLRAARPVDLADLAPTFADLLDFPFAAPDGTALREALRPGSRPPRAIVLVVYDGGGWNLLEEYPDEWPVVRRLARRGTTYVNATLGSSPSVTAAVHPTMGAGAYPRAHGIPDNTVRLPGGFGGVARPERDPAWPGRRADPPTQTGGEIGDAYFGRTDPALLSAETLADAWDRARGNRPWVGIVATESWHLGMMGAGAGAPGGDRDVAILWNREEGRFFTNPGLYRLPDDLPETSELERGLTDLDRGDGAVDGRWMDHDLADPAIIPATPAFVSHQGRALLDVVRRAPIGRDAVTDLLFVELKSTDRGAHVWNLFGREEPIVLRAQDRLVGRLVRTLDRTVGPDRYVLAVTADHGLTPLPERVGGLRVHPDVVGSRVNAFVGTEVVEAATPASLFLDAGAVREAGLSLSDVARFVGDLRLRDVIPDEIEPAPSERMDERVLAAALPGPFVDALEPAEIEALGDGRYPEGDLRRSGGPGG